MERLNKYLAKAGLGSRRGVEKIINQGLVTINGIKAILNSTVSDGDIVKVEGKVINPQKNVYLLINKPKGVVTTLSDPHAKAKIIDLLPEELRGVFPVGRLDKDTTGLLILTNDGDLAFKLTHPKFRKEKEYLVKAIPMPNQKSLEALSRGVMLEDGISQPAKIETKDGQIFVTITEGRNRQVRRMFEAIGSKVIELKRIRFAKISLGNVKEGKYRFLSAEELKELKND